MSEIDRIFRCPDVTGQGGLGFFRPPFPEFGKVVEKSRPASAFFDHLCPWRRDVGISHVRVQKNSGKYFKNNKNSENFRKFQKKSGMRPAGSGEMQKSVEMRWPVPANFRIISEMRPAGSGKIHTNSEMRRPVPAKVRKIHSTCPGVFQIDRNLQQIHMRAMSLGLCKKDFVFGVDTVGIFRYRSPMPKRENLHAPLVRTVEKGSHSRYLPCAGLSPLSRAEQLWGRPLPG